GGADRGRAPSPFEALIVFRAGMLVRFTKGPVASRTDTLDCVRPDGSRTTATMARQGILPHEAIHFVVESTLRWHDAMFGELARGGTVEAINARLHGGQQQWTRNTQARQAESLVECLEAEQWGGPSDPLSF